MCVLRMTVPPRAIHTFKNASDTEPAEFFMTATPGKRYLCSNGPSQTCLLFPFGRRFLSLVRNKHD
jgi:hypothetical protein